MRDMILYKNAEFITCQPENRVCKAMAVEKEHIAWIGDEPPASLQVAKTVDLGGAAVVPAFADTHIHFESYCIFESTFHIGSALSFGEAKDRVAAYADANPKAKILLGFGACAHLVKEKRLPARRDLDTWSARPLLIIKYDGHAAVGNTALLKVFTKAVTDDPGFDGETGWLYGSAFYNGVNEITSRISIAGIIRGLSLGASRMARAGIGYAHAVEGVGFPRDMDVDMLRALRFGLPQTFRVFFQTMDVAKVVKRRLKRIGGCFSLALDGCFGSRDAALSVPYAGEPENYGQLSYTQEQVNAFAIAANRAGLQIAMHAIGDRAVEQCITAYESALADFPREDHRHTIIHCCLASPSQLERIARLKVCVTLQTPTLYWPQEPDSYLRGILGGRVDNIMPIGSMHRVGIMVADGSDAPCTPPDPIRGMACAVNHPNPAERVTSLQALMMRTYNPAFLGFDENERGSLAVGKAADFTVLSRNPLTVPRGKIGDITVKALYLRGKPADYKARGMASLLLKAAAGKLGGRS
jgi:predicted amidohydrolase YtcJ